MSEIRVAEREPFLQRKRKYCSSGRVCLLGINCNYGTDDPLFLSVFALAIRGTWIVYGLFLLCYYFSQPGCSSPAYSTLLTTSLVGLLTLQVLISLIFLAVGAISTLGTLTKPKPRQPNIVMMHILLFSLLVELSWLVFSIYVAAGGGLKQLSQCAAYQRTVTLFYVAVGVGWLINSLLILVFIVSLDPCSCFTVNRAVGRIKRIEAAYNDDEQQAHRRTCGHFCCCCCRSNPFRTAAGDLVTVLGQLLGDFDITLANLVVGVHLTGYYQRQLIKHGKSPNEEMKRATVTLLKENGSVSTTYSTPDPTPLTEQEVEKLSSQCRSYIIYTLASYTGITCYSDTPVRATLNQCKAARGCICYPYCRSRHFDGDNLIANASVLATTLGISQSNIVTASFVNSVFELPYFVVYDHVKNELVLTIRGTLSVQDALTDLSVAFLEFPGGFLGVENAFIHRGFYRSAELIYSKLMENDEFADLLAHNEFSKFLITGHSLGAAACAVLAILFKEKHKDQPWVSKIEAFLFATPGAVMNYSLAEKTKDFMVSVVASNDIVPRASLRSFGYLRLLVERLFATTDSSKSRIMCCSGGTAWQCYPPMVPQDENIVGLEDNRGREFCSGFTCEEEDGYDRLKDFLPFTVLNKNLKKPENGDSNVGRSSGSDQPLMFMPGRILHLTEEQEQPSTKCTGGSSRVTGSWLAREALSTILVHPDMIADHFPDRYESHCKRFN